MNPPSHGLLVCAAVLLASGAAGAQSAPLESARRAYDAIDYARARQILVDALKSSGEDTPRVPLYEMLVTVHLVLGDADAARRAIARILEIQPDYELPTDASPRIDELFREVSDELAAARARTERVPEPVRELPQEPAVSPPPPTPAVPSPTLPPPPDTASDAGPWYGQWWVWTVAGVVLGATATALWVYNNPRAPGGHVGPVSLP